MVGYRKVNCSASEVIYQCTNYKSSFLNWELALNGQNSYFSLNTQRNSEGVIVIQAFGTHSVKYEVISANNTLFRATVTMDAVELNGTIIICNGITKTLLISISCKLIL